jgi:cobalt-precorrin 5A hydrolase
MNIGIISVTKQGDKLAEKIKSNLSATVYSKNAIPNFDLKSITKELMENCEALIFIASTGIAVRAVAPFIKNKAVDPAVLVVDCSGNFVISLLSGHLGGANELTLKVADLIKAQPVITTATDNLGLVAPDMIAKDNNLIIEDFKKAKIIASKLVEGKPVFFIDERNLIDVTKGYTKGVRLFNERNVKLDDGNLHNASKEYVEIEKHLTRPKGYVDGEKLLAVEKEDIECEKQSLTTNIVYISNKLNLPKKLMESNIEILKLIRKDIILGIGCRKYYPSDKMRETIIEVLKRENIDIRAVKVIATVEVKKDEKAILELAEFLNCPINIFTIDEIKKVQHKYEGSDFVEKTIGVRAVSEPVVELSNCRILTGKLSLKGMTLCIGEEKV